MADPIWYLGPAGDLRPLVCPERDIDITVERYGGIFQGLSGARTVDITGFRQKVEFNFSYLADVEYKWLESLFFRIVPGPHRLINPMKKNRLSPESSIGRWGAGTAQGLKLTSGALTTMFDWPSAAGTFGATSSKWTGRLSNAVFRTDVDKKIPVFPLETITASVYMKASAPVSYNLVVDWYDRTSQVGSTSILVASVTTSWQRFSITGTAPAGAIAGALAGYSTNTAADVYLGPMQFESGASATSWEAGGGAPSVALGDMQVVSPRFPYRNTKLILLEA